MRLRFAAIGLAALGSVALAASSASAMPNGIPQASQIANQSAQVDQVRWVCNRWGRCWWRPGPRGWGRPWHRGWRRW